jgi:hypothetical protein
VILVEKDVSEELIASIIRETKISQPRTTLAVIINVVPSSLDFLSYVRGYRFFKNVGSYKT